MCGIAALFRFGSASLSPAVLSEMTDAVAHRGPDGSGLEYFALSESGLRSADPQSDWTIGLGHRRLSILDLSDAGRQPMVYRDQLWITYNGELFNYVEVRTELEQHGHSFRSSSDTEVILAAYAEWGTGCFARFRGMWGLVLLDGRRRQAILCRDRLGIKPLYYTRTDDVLAIASEIKQFRALPGLCLKPNRSALWQYILSGYEDSEQTFFENVTPLTAGTYCTLDLDTGRPASPLGYWTPENIRPTIHDAGEGARLFGKQLQQSVAIHLRSDVPVGCALSGGLDSSSVAACIMQIKQPGDPPLHTFSATFPGHAIDEQKYIDSVVRHLRVTPHVVSPKPDEMRDDLDRFVFIHDEPVGGLSQYAAYAVARLTREYAVPVTLNGQGGDEILAGYWQSYFVYLRGLGRQKKLLQLASHFGGALTPWGNHHVWGQIPVMFRRYRDRAQAGQREGLGDAAEAGRRRLASRIEQVMQMSDQERRVYEIRELHLPRLLKWDDRNFMAFAVEGRYPFLDHQLIETALSLDARLLYRAGWTKEPLRRAMTGVLPNDIVRRRTKFGFETPQIDWMLGALRPALETFVGADSPVWDYVEPTYARELADQVWREQGRRDNPAHELFRLFLVDRWMQSFSLTAA